jgi:glycosyltransferase involved in cell wall biosynthesis
VISILVEYCLQEAVAHEIPQAGVAQALENLYRDPQRRRELAQAACAFAQDPAYSWEVIIRQVDDLFVRLAT